MKQEIKDILFGDDVQMRRTLFCFNITDDTELVRKKFNYWAKFYQTKYFKVQDADFHKEIDTYNIQAYKGELDSFTDIVFRGGAKSARTKLFLAYAIANDLDHFRRYIKVLSEDNTNSKQIVTDIYNIFVGSGVRLDYPELFQKTNTRREETMSSFTTSTGVKLIADTVGSSQRGAIQDDVRPDLVWFEDFENRITLRSATITQGIWDNMEEARTGLSANGSCIYTCNYISEAGNVHRLVQKKSERNKVLIVPIVDKQGNLAWEQQYSQVDIERMRQNDDDFEGERLCEPSASADVVFDREILTSMPTLIPEKDTYGFKIFKQYDATHFYASGHDVSSGKGLDSATSAFIDFTAQPCEVVATYANNLIEPELFGEEIKRQQDIFGGCVSAPENNLYDRCIYRLRQLGGNIYATMQKSSKIKQNRVTDYGWRTGTNKSNMIVALTVAINKGELVIYDEDLIAELKSYTRNDMLDRSIDPRLTTRHFDLLMALAIAWQMKDYPPVFFPKQTKSDIIAKPLNHGWVAQQNQKSFIEETYLL